MKIKKAMQEVLDELLSLDTSELRAQMEEHCSDDLTLTLQELFAFSGIPFINNTSKKTIDNYNQNQYSKKEKAKHNSKPNKQDIYQKQTTKKGNPNEKQKI